MNMPGYAAESSLSANRQCYRANHAFQPTAGMGTVVPQDCNSDCAAWAAFCGVLTSGGFVFNPVLGLVELLGCTAAVTDCVSKCNSSGGSVTIPGTCFQKCMQTCTKQGNKSSCAATCKDACS
jgi:hypothetical protein